MSSPPPRPAPSGFPTRIGRYDLLLPIASGGMATVYLASVRGPMGFEAEVALKLTHPHLRESTEFAADLLEEAKLAVRIRHRNVAAVIDAGIDPLGVYLVMEYVEGDTLSGLSKGSKPLPKRMAMRVLVDALAGLHAAHELRNDGGELLGVVHRDFTPHNILVGTDGVARLTDFGIAKAATRLGHTRTGFIKGKIAYMAPEQACGSPVDRRCDVWAAGVIAWEILSGRPLHRVDNDVATLLEVVNTAPPRLRSIDPSIPPEIDEAVASALDRNVETRCPSALAFSRRLAAACKAQAFLVAETEEVAEWLGFVAGGRLAARREDLALAKAVRASEPPPPPPASREKLRARASVVAGAATVREMRGAGAAVDPFGDTQVSHHTGEGVASDRGAMAKPPHRKGGLSRLVATGLTVAAVALGFVFVRAQGPSTTAPAAPPSAASAPRHLGLLDLPLPVTKSADALASYVAGLQAMHDSSRELARQRLLLAATQDPSLGAAHLRYAIVAYFPVSEGPRKHFNQALAMRATMSPYDQALLDATEPIFDRQPPDWGECERKLDAATKRFPEDAELFTVLAFVRQQLGDLDGVMRATDAALALDPTYAAAMHDRARAAILASDWSAARDAAERCLAAVPQASTCLDLRMLEEAWAGRCVDYESDARRIISIDLDGADGYQKLADASLVLGKPLDTVRETLAQEWSRMGDEDKEWLIATDKISLALLVGDAAGVRSAIDQMQRFAAPRGEALYHMIPAWAGVLWETETGHVDRAAAIADDYLRRLDAWTPDDGIDLFSVSYNMRPFMNKALVRAGKLAPAGYASRRQEWIDGWKRRVSATTARYIWIYGYAMEADTPEDASEALDALPAYAPVPEFAPPFHATADVGHVFLLGGRLDDAVRWLRASAHDCDAWASPFEWVKASLWLGQALEQQGDVGGACTAYGDVLKRWAPFGKLSTNATLASKRITALGCGKWEARTAESTPLKVGE